MKNSRIAFFEGGALTSSAERTLPAEILLIRFGKNTFTKNGETGEFDFTGPDADAVLLDFTERGRDLVIDFEHQSLSGEKAPAAGWIDRLEKTSEGLLAHIKYWTDEARQFLLQGQYRYFSPTLYFSRSGKKVTAIHSAALTNHPAMHGIPALVADDLPVSASDDASESTADPSVRLKPSTSNQEENMNEFLVPLGLEAFRDAADEQQHEALSRRITELCDTEKNLHSFLSLHGLNDLDAVAAKLTELQKLEGNETVRQAFADGKLTENMRDWATDFAVRDPAAFQVWREAAPRIVPDNREIVPAPFSESDRPLASDPEEAKILRLLGLTEKNLAEKKNKKGNC